LRSIVFRFEDQSAFCRALDDSDGTLALGPNETAKDGEWVLALFEVGAKRRATAAAARAVHQSGSVYLRFEPRDWERLVAFSSARSEHFRISRPAESKPRLDLTPETEAISSTAMRADPPPASAGSATSSGRFPAAVTARVLLVDDEAETREVVAAMLEAVGLEVEPASSAEEALEKVARGGFDLLVLDWTLPGMSGLELCRRLRAEAHLASLPVLFLSGHSSSKDIVDAFACGADDFVVKPFRAPELGARIFGLLRRARLAKNSDLPTSGHRNG
jgi:two-component system phosphate regulon response regulator PhoB